MSAAATCKSTAILWCLTLASLLTATVLPAQDKPSITILPQAEDAVELALTDMENMVRLAALNNVSLDTSSYRYVWIPSGNPEDQALTSFVLNSVVSRSDINYAPHYPNSPIQYLAQGKLIRFDLRTLCPLNRGKDFEEVAKVWDDLFNPYFMIENEGLQTVEDVVDGRVVAVRQPGVIVRVGQEDLGTLEVGDELEFVDELTFKNKRWCQVRYQGKVGFIELNESVEIIEVKRQAKTQLAKVFGPHVNPEAGAALQAFTKCNNPIVWFRSLYDQALTQAASSKPTGGKYYRFLGIRKANEEERKRGLSDEDVWLQSLGISLELIDRQRAEQRVGITVSGVTAKPRRIDFFNRPGRIGTGQGLIVITQDVLDDDYDPAADPLLNLLNFKVGGKEVLFQLNNGHIGYVLFDGKGNLVDEAPPNLVSDHDIPSPYTTRLQPGISCIRCHSKGNEEGWRAFDNNVRDHVNQQLDIFDDTEGTKRDLDLQETLEKLAALYKGDLTVPAMRAREDHTRAIIECVGRITNQDGNPWRFHDVGQTLAERFNYYRFSPVDPIKACHDLGYVVKDQAVALTLINRLLDRLPPEIGVPIQREDGRLAFLKQGDPINRYQWELVQIDAATRSRHNAAKALDEVLAKQAD